LTDLYFDVRGFIHAYDRSDDRYLTYLLREEQSLTVKIFCIDPSRDIGEHLATGRSAIFFSATLLPVQYYKEMLSDTAEEDYDLYVDSPFDISNRLLVAACDVSTKYTRRNRKEYEKIALYIRDIIRGRHGNYMIFFPSYQLMKDVFDVFTEMELVKAGHGLHVVMQETGMQEEKRQEFLEQFQTQSRHSTIGFCVMGGIFSEGIDLKEDRLIGAVIVGTGLPQVGPERELLSRYFNEKCGMGFEYAYLYPGMNKVLQAGGRVIRTENDKGVIALLDERFNYQQYRQIFPREWQDCKKTHLFDIRQQVEDFWTEKT
jgi:Rad3-related DNA helicase